MRLPRRPELSDISRARTLRDIFRETMRLLQDDTYRHEVVEHNYETARRYFSYAVLQRSLRYLLNTLVGWTPENGFHLDDQPDAD